MIDEARTLELFGYTSDALSNGSHKKVVAVCDDCGRHRVVKKQAYRDLCASCVKTTKYLSDESRVKMASMTGKRHSKESKRRMSEAQKGKTFSEEHKHKLKVAWETRKIIPVSKETRHKMSIVGKGRMFTESHKRKICDAHKGRKNTEEHCINMSCGRRGIPRDEFTGYAKQNPYCEKFDESCRERNRDKHGRVCFICGMEETKNGRKLSVHHCDMNKSQGCDGEKWKLVPLCNSCHGKVHTPLWQARIEYLLKYI